MRRTAAFGLLLPLLVAAAVAPAIAARDAAEEGLWLEDVKEESPVDSSSTMALLASYDDDDDARHFAKHTNGHCSYKGYRTSRCPHRHECRAGHRCLVNPSCRTAGQTCGIHSCCSGLECKTDVYPRVCATASTCLAINANCSSNSTFCCSGNCVDGLCCESGKLALDATCNTNSSCCSNNCITKDFNTGLLCCPPGKLPYDAPCVNHEDCCTNACTSNKCFCFAAGTLVNVRTEGGSAVRRLPIEELRVGMSVQCLGASDDMRLPHGQPKWCEMKAWHHADPKTFEQVRVSFRRPADGSTGATMLSPSHMVFRMAADGVMQGASAATIDALGAFETVQARQVQPGRDRLALLQGGEFVVVAVTAVEKIQARGAYVPALEAPFLIADGLVAPLHSDIPVPVAAPAGAGGVGAKNAFMQYMFAPLWMSRGMQPLGTPSTAGDVIGPNSEWWGVHALRAARGPHVAAGKAVSFEAMRAWFLPRLKAWRRDPAAAITLDDVVAFLRADETWVAPAYTPPTGDSQPTTATE